MTIGVAESAFRIAKIYQQKNDVPNALKYFAAGAEASRKLESTAQLSDALIGESVLLINVGRGEDPQRDREALLEKVLHDNGTINSE